jgi:hypothetical protein
VKKISIKPVVGCLHKSMTDGYAELNDNKMNPPAAGEFCSVCLCHCLISPFNMLMFVFIGAAGSAATSGGGNSTSCQEGGVLATAQIAFGLPVVVSLVGTLVL